MASREVHTHFIKCVVEWESYTAISDMYPPNDERVVESRLRLERLLDRFELKNESN